MFAKRKPSGPNKQAVIKEFLSDPLLLRIVETLLNASDGEIFSLYSKGAAVIKILLALGPGLAMGLKGEEDLLALLPERLSERQSQLAVRMIGILDAKSLPNS